MSDAPGRFDQAIQAIDAANAQDPNLATIEGDSIARELLYSRRMTEWLGRIAPHASEALRLAARAQHIMRWKIPRSDYPMDRAGYLRWRTRLYVFHADAAAEIMRSVGYDNATILRVQSLLRKEQLKTDAEAQMLEDVICLVFLENYFSEFAVARDEKKLQTIIRRTWNKMSDHGRELGLGLKLPPRDRATLQKALEPFSGDAKAQ